MSIERDRLLALVEFAHHSARLRSKVAATVTEHGIFELSEHQIRGLPGIRVTVNSGDSGDEVWLAVQRLHETRPPDISSAVLRPWLEMTQSATEEPKLRQITTRANLIAAGTHSPSDPPLAHSTPAFAAAATGVLAEYENADVVRAEFTVYLDTMWRPWAKEERLRRKTISLYSKLFTLKHQLEGGLVETQLELVWGVGVGIWGLDGITASYPLVARLVEMSLNAETAAMEIRPRDIDAHLETDWYASVNNPGVDNL